MAGSGIVETLGVGITDKFDQISNKSWVKYILFLTSHESFNEILLSG